VQNYYTYEPFGQTIESGGTLDNPFRFTGQYFDSEIEEYYLRARQYNPHLARFTSRDPVASDDSWPLPSARNLSCNSNWLTVSLRIQKSK
jgi:RHS repeat-associated protein